MAEVLNIFQHSTSKYASQERRLEVQPRAITYERKKDPNASLIEFDRAPPKVIDKPVSRVVEVLKPVPVDKVVERVRERAEVVEKCRDEYVNAVYDEVLRIEEKVKNVTFERVVHKEVVQEVIVDKFVDLIIEVIKEVPVTRVVERKVEVIEEVPFVRFVDRVITKPVPVTRVVERVVEVIKEVPVETIREVPVYVKVDVSTGEELQSRDRVTWTNKQTIVGNGHFVSSARIEPVMSTRYDPAQFAAAVKNAPPPGERYVEYDTAPYSEAHYVNAAAAPPVNYAGAPPAGFAAGYQPTERQQDPRYLVRSVPAEEPVRGEQFQPQPVAGASPQTEAMHAPDSGAPSRKWEEALM